MRRLGGYKKTNKMLKKTGERIIPENFKSEEEYLLYLRHVYAYETAIKHIKKGSKVLEIGSGEGYGSTILSKKAKEVVCIDVDEKSIEYAKENYGSKKVKFRTYNGTKLPFKKEEFDFIISFQVVEHVEDVPNYLNEAKRVLKKKGLFIITTPNRNHRLAPGEAPWNRFHYREYSPKDFEKELRSVFKKSKVLGIKGKGKVQQIEINRINRIRKVVAVDFLQVRRFLPRPVKTVITRCIKLLKREEREKSGFSTKFTSKDFVLLKGKEAEKGLDLLGYCEK